MTFGKGEPIALAAINMGYSVVPSQSDKDENGNLLKDPFDPRCTEWLVEIPCETSWANLTGADEIEVGNFSAIAQYDFYMQVQKHYTTHNTSSTIELREHEIEPLANAIYNSIQSDKGYISSALLARFDSLETFPRMPFEPISKDVYADMMTAIALRSEGTSFREALSRHDRGQTKESGPSGCDSDRCLLSLPDKK
jgi:ribonucleotide reductase class II